jgi:hypothetical protein
MEVETPYRVDALADVASDQVRITVDGESVSAWEEAAISDGGRPVEDDRRATDVEWRVVPEPPLCRELGGGL